VNDEELARRRSEWTPPQIQYPRGFGRLHALHVTQADLGCDFDFLEGTAAIPDPDIH
jgi:dihydroxy-acid dehydratase